MKHKNCKLITIKEKSSGYVKTKLNSLIERSNALKVLNDKFVRQRTASLENLRLTKEKYMEKVQKFRKELNTLLDELENNTLIQLEGEETKQKQQIEDHISASEIIYEMLQTDIDHLQDVMKTEETETVCCWH